MRTQRRRRGQTLVLLAMLAGILVVAAALVIDNGTQQKVRAETQGVADAASLAGMAELAATRDPQLALDKCLQYCGWNGYTVGEDGVTAIDAYCYDSTTGQRNVASSDRYHVKISRELPQYLMSAFGRHRTGVTMKSVSALLSAAPVDVSLELDINTQFGEPVGFPTKATLAQNGPTGNYELGDPFSMPLTHRGRTNGTYQGNGLRFDLVVPGDLAAGGGSTWVRLEIFDPDCINDPAKYVQGNPSHPATSILIPTDTNGDPTEPEKGAIDEIFGPPPGPGGNTTAANFPARSTQTEYVLLDGNMAEIARASYGPTSNSPFWYHNEAPATRTPRTATNVDPARAQQVVDLRWITPVGFEFDTAAHRGPYRLMIRPAAGTSVNGYSLRLSKQRGDGVTFDPYTHGMTATSVLGVYAHGKVSINFLDMARSTFTAAAVPAATEYVRISNFDTDGGPADLTYSMTGFDESQGSPYPILFAAPTNAAGPDVVQDTAGSKYYTALAGTRSPNASWRADTVNLLDPQPIPQVDGSGALVFDLNGRINILDRRTFEGGDLQVTFRGGGGGNHDLSGWQFSYFKPQLVTGEQEIILMR